MAFYGDTFTSDLTGTGSDDTREGALIRSGAKHTTSTITLNANNTSASVNVFQVTGSVLVTSIHGEVLDATTLTNCTAAYFDLYDGSAASVITKATGAALSGFNVGAFFIKDEAIASILTVINNDQANVVESSTNKASQPFITIQKTGTDTFIRFNYATTDAPINAQLKVDIHYADIDSGIVVAV